MARVSFIVIAYNISEYINRCLDSIMKQSLGEIEIIVVDDGSTDDTGEKILELSKVDARIKYIKQENAGANGARKKGLMESNGEFVMFVDGDDWVSLDVAEKMYSKITSHDADICTYNYFRAFDGGREEIYEDTIYTDIKSNRYLQLLLKQKISHSIWGKIIRASFIKNSEFINVCGISMAEDLAANVALAIKSPKVVMGKEAYYYYYQRSTSTMNKSSERLLEIKQSLVYIENLLLDNHILKDYRQEIDYLWFLQCYCMRVVCTKLDVDRYHKELYNMWKERGINTRKNPLCQEYIKRNIGKYRLIIKTLFDMNYAVGSIVLKIEHCLRGF